MHYTQMKRSVGIAVLFLIGLLVSFIVFIILEKDYLEPRYTFHFVVNDASAVSVGTPLTYSGFTIGMIDEIELLKSGEAQMSFSLSKKDRHWIRKNTELTIKRPLVGSSHIEISPSDASSPILEANAFVKVKLSNDINDIIERLEPIVYKATNIVNNIDKITTYLADEDSDLLQSIQNINRITYKIAHDDSLLTSLTGDRNATQSVIASLAHLAEVLQEVAHISASLDDKIVDPTSATINDLDSIMKDIQSKLRLLHGTVKEIGRYKTQLSQARKKISATIHKSNQVVNRVDTILGGSSDQKVELP